MNLSHHSFFNLKGEGGGTVLDNVLTIKGDYITPTDERLIPTGELRAVEGTPYDFREPHVIGERIDADNDQLKFGNGYDMNWVLSREDNGQVETVATLYDPTTGRCMDVATDQIGLQFYSGNFFEGTYNGKYGEPRASVSRSRWRRRSSPMRPTMRTSPRSCSTRARPIRRPVSINSTRNDAKSGIFGYDAGGRVFGHGRLSAESLDDRALTARPSVWMSMNGQYLMTTMSR